MDRLVRDQPITSTNGVLCHGTCTLLKTAARMKTGQTKLSLWTFLRSVCACLLLFSLTSNNNGSFITTIMVQCRTAPAASSTNGIAWYCSEKNRTKIFFSIGHTVKLDVWCLVKAHLLISKRFTGFFISSTFSQLKILLTDQKKKKTFIFVFSLLCLGLEPIGQCRSWRT